MVITLGCERQTPISCFTSSVAQASVNDPISFDMNCSEDASLITWDFGDGTKVSSRDLTIAHSYSSPGEYIVTLRVCEHAMWFKGKTDCDSFSKTITVGQ